MFSIAATQGGMFQRSLVQGRFSQPLKQAMAVNFCF